MKLLKYYLLILLLPSLAISQTKEPEVYQAVFQLDKMGQNEINAVLATNFETKKAAYFELDANNKLKKISEINIEDNIWKSSSYVKDKEKYIVIAFGYGRGKLDAPLSIKLFSKKLEPIDEIFNYQTERSQTAHLEQIGNKLLLSFFDSKYFTRTGFLRKTTAKNWEFVELFRKRLAAHIAVAKKSLLVGRPYGDDIGVDGDVLLYKNNTFTKLPSLRGVRSIAGLNTDSDDDLEILVGDGWHQNYGELAEPRLSLIDKKYDQYVLTNIFKAKAEFAIEKIVPLRVGTKTYVLAAGEKTLWLFDPEKNWTNKEIHTSSGGTSFIDFAVLKTTEDSIYLAILDNELLVREVQIEFE